MPHEFSEASKNTRDFYKTLDLIIAEVSYPATGLGVELGWAYDDGTPIVCVYQSGTKPSGSLHAITDQFFEYRNKQDLLEIIQRAIGQYHARH